MGASLYTWALSPSLTALPPPPPSCSITYSAPTPLLVSRSPTPFWLFLLSLQTQLVGLVLLGKRKITNNPPPSIILCPPMHPLPSSNFSQGWFMAAVSASPALGLPSLGTWPPHLTAVGILSPRGQQGPCNSKCREHSQPLAFWIPVLPLHKVSFLDLLESLPWCSPTPLPGLCRLCGLNVSGVQHTPLHLHMPALVLSLSIRLHRGANGRHLLAIPWAPHTQWHHGDLVPILYLFLAFSISVGST